MRAPAALRWRENLNLQRTSFPRRTALKRIGAGLFGGAFLAGTASATAHPGGSPPPLIPPLWVPIWGSDGTDNWEITDTGPTGRDPPGDDPPERPLDIIPPILAGEVNGYVRDPVRSPHFLVVDRIVDTPPKNRGRYNAKWYSHNNYYDGPDDQYVGMPYTGINVMTNSGAVAKGFLELLAEISTDFPPLPEFATPDPNDGGYLNTISKVREAAPPDGFAGRTSDPNDIPDECYPHSLEDLPFGLPDDKGLFVGFTFVYPLRPLIEH